MKQRLARVLAVLSLLVATVSAQSSGNNSASLVIDPDILTSGESVEVTYSNPDLAGETITVEVNDGQHKDPQTDQITIVLDADGNGSAVWEVPSWPSANFNAPDVEEEHCPIMPSLAPLLLEQAFDDEQVRRVRAHQDRGPAAIAN